MATTRKLLKGKGKRQDEKNEDRDYLTREEAANHVTDTSSIDDTDDRLEHFLPDEQSEMAMNLVNSKMAVMSICDETGVSLYLHLSEMLSRVLTSWDAGQAVDEMEEISQHLKKERTKTDLTVTKVQPPIDDIVSRQWQLFKKIGREIPDDNPVFAVRNDHNYHHRPRGDQEGSQNEGKDGSPSKSSNRKPTDDSVEARLAVLPDLMRQCHMFNMAGVGLPPTEYTKIALAMRELASTSTFKSMRFWGKILGSQSNYYIVETQLYEEDYDVTDDDNEDDDDLDEGFNNDDPPSEASSFLSDNDIPMIPFKRLPPVPKEIPGQGVNVFVYYACNQPGLPWIRLPDVTPQQITAARQITSLFTGHLDHVHATYPPFPGNEANYLRAQVARITSGTCISPIGYFMFDEEDEEEEQAESRDTCIPNEDFEGVSMRDLSDSSLQFWVHHVNYILPQGRTVWLNPLNAARDEGEDEEEFEEERREPDEPEPEFPQPLLIPISEDVDVGQSPSWTTRLTSQFVPEHSPVAAVSVRWPGAVTVATNRGAFYANFYVGLGLKALESNFDPALPSEAAWEFPTGSEVMEKEDPTPGEEAAIKAALKEHELDENEDEEEEQEVEDEEDEEIDDD